jgi:hypothetical protein
MRRCFGGGCVHSSPLHADSCSQQTFGEGENEGGDGVLSELVMQGQDCCRVSFLPCAYAMRGNVYDGVLCQVTHVGSALSTNKAERKKFHNNARYAQAQVILELRTKGKESKYPKLTGNTGEKYWRGRRGRGRVVYVIN